MKDVSWGNVRGSTSVMKLGRKAVERVQAGPYGLGNALVYRASC